MDHEQFDRDLGALSATLGDATRRGVYITIRESAEPLTATQISEMFSIHPNVARHHLDRLAQDGYVTVTRKRRSGRTGPGAGRPAKCYSASDKEIALQYPSRRMDLLTSLLLDLVAELAPEDAAARAREIGYRHGTEVANEIGLPSDEGFDTAVAAVAKAMTGMGFTMRADADRSELLTSHCPFGETALDYPEVVCSLDQGLIAGLMSSVTWEPVVIPHTQTDDACVTKVHG